MASLGDFLALLKGVKRARDGQYIALCPGHHDTKPSLSVKEADGKILVQCFGGCDLAAILKPLGLEPKDLFLNSHQTKLHEREIEAIYKYVDASGKSFEVVRTRPKGFYQRRPVGKGGYINNLKGIVPTLYHQDKLKEAIESGKPIFVVEGEKDADQLWSLGLVATTNPMGAGKWRDRYTETLRGADLVIIPDNDDPGRNHANQVAKSVNGVAGRVRLLELLGDCKDISDWLDTGGDIKELERLVAQCPEYEPPLNTDLPWIVVTDRHLRDITADTLTGLYKANKPERIFRRSGALTRIGLDEKRRLFTETLSESALRGHLARCCNFTRVTAKGDRVATTPPVDVVRDIDSLGVWLFPPLLGVTEVPVIRPDGTMITEQGYDSLSNLYYFPSPKLSVPPIPDMPTEDDVKTALQLVFEPVCDFPFDSEADKANAIATMFTPILRPMIDGSVPLAIIDKPQSGTGASLLSEVISLVATGRTAAMMTARRDEEEWRKAITSILLRGQLVVTIDNIEGTLFAPSLSTVLTATTYQNRILGRSEMVTLPNRITWLATGNNIELGGDLPRRCIWVYMHAKMARPWLRDPSSFRRPRLIEWVSENRGAILAAILAIARTWVVAGMPEASELPNLGGFESYCRVVGGVLGYMGVKGFLGNLDAMYNEADTETTQWEVFLETWHDIIDETPVTAAELIKHMNDYTDLRTTLPDTIADTEVKNYSVRLGQKLGKKNAVRYPDGFALVKAGEKKRAVTWKVLRFKNETSPLNTKKVRFSEVNLSKIPDYPPHICPTYRCRDYWLTDWNTWLCSRCHSKPEGSNRQC